MSDGSEKEITSISVGEWIRGGQVQAKMEFLPDRIYDYKGVYVTGSHLVMEDGQFVEVEDSKNGIPTLRVEPVYCFETSESRIWINGVEFGDYMTGTNEQWEPHIESMKKLINQEIKDKLKVEAA